MSQMIEERDWRYAWIKRTVERMEELDSRGEKEVTISIREFQHILMELLAMHQRNDRLEDVLCSYARYAFPVNQKIEPPAMFGGEQIDKSKWGVGMVGTPPSKPEHCHLFVGTGNGYSVCNDCGMSDVYYNWAYNKKSIPPIKDVDFTSAL